MLRKAIKTYDTPDAWPHDKASSYKAKALLLQVFFALLQEALRHLRRVAHMN